MRASQKLVQVFGELGTLVGSKPVAKERRLLLTLGLELVLAELPIWAPTKKQKEMSTWNPRSAPEPVARVQLVVDDTSPGFSQAVVFE